MKFLVLLLTLAACGHDRDNPEQASPSDIPALEEAAAAERASLAAELTPTLYDNVKDCDWTLWCGIAAAAGLACDIGRSEYPDAGVIQRRPEATCYDGQDRGSKSTVSNDTLTGYMLGMYRVGNTAALRRLYDYGAGRNWQMGEPLSRPGEVLMKPALQALLAFILGEQGLPYTYLHVTEDYAQHIQTLQIILWGEVDSGSRALLDIDDQMLKRIQENAQEHPDDYLFAAAEGVYSGDYGRAVDLLLARGAPPSYVRGERADLFARVHWLFAADLVLRHQK